MGQQRPAKEVYKRIVDDFQAVMREYHSNRHTFNADLLAKHTDHFRSRLAKAELPIPQTNLVQYDNGRSMKMELILDPEADAYLEAAWAEEV